MDHPQDGTATASEAALPSIRQQIRQAAFYAWTRQLEDGQEASEALFEQAYLGHYASIDHYVETLVDDYDLDARIDAAIAEPFREFVDVDVTALARSLVHSGSLYALPAMPLGVWVFSGEIR